MYGQTKDALQSRSEDVWGRLQVVSKTVVCLESCFASRVVFYRIFMAVCYYHRRLLMRFFRSYLTITVDLEFPGGSFISGIAWP